MIKILTHYTKSWKDLADITVCNMMEYCERHGYELVNWEVSDYSKYTGIYKLTLISNVLEYEDIALVLDADAMITNFNHKIEQYIDDSHDLFLCKDVNGINTGSFIIRWTKWSEKLIEYLFQKVEKNIVDCEQNAIELYIEQNSMNRIKILPHPSINSYPMDEYAPSYGLIGYPQIQIPKPTHEEGDWQEGSFICHLPGINLNKRIEIFKNIKVIK